MVELPLAALIFADRFGALDTFALALFDEPSFHLRNHPQDRQDHVTHFATGADIGVNRHRGSTPIGSGVTMLLSAISSC
jgi:hypothetical protein